MHLILKRRMHVLEDIRKIINPYLLEFNNAYDAVLKSDVRLLNEITSYLKISSGKQIRPIYTYLSALLCGEATPRTTRTALAIELLHTSTLIHDDVVDNSKIRRGLNTINTKWNNKLAVLSGDYLLSLVLNTLSNYQDTSILSILSRISIELSEGEVLQQEKSMECDYSEGSYYEIIRRKTGALLSACYEGGAVSAGASAEKTQLLKRIGENVGIAFQIKDDILDYSPQAKTGKICGNDIREKKFTLPLIGYMNEASPQEKEYILNIFGSEEAVSDEVVNMIIEKTVSSNGIEYAHAGMKKYIDLALHDLDIFAPSKIKTALRNSIIFSMDRML